MFFKNLLTKWNESLEIFKWQNLKLFLLASLNNFKRSIIILIKNFWIIAIYTLLIFIILSYVAHLFDIFIKYREYADPFLGSYFLHKIKIFNTTSYSIWKTLILYTAVFLSTTINFALQLFLFLTIRPSIENKNLAYFFKYTNKIIGVALISIALSIFNSSLSPIIPFSILFLLDSKNSIKSFLFSILNGFQMLIYNILPIIIFGLLIEGIIYFFNTLDIIIPSLIISTSLNLFILLLRFFYLCAISIYYTKIKHKDFNLFLFE